MKKNTDISTLDNELISAVLSYYKENARVTLPWRVSITPYRILVSEIMLQQTQVARVKEKFKEWMKTYPSLRSLNKASLQEVLLIWQGLGYQRRAKALFRIGKEYNRIPKTFEELSSLPGVGTYTASAVLAFAYNSFSHPLLETNIRTVLIEFFHSSKSSVHDSVLYEDLFRLEGNANVIKLGAREWYYALMDYGAYLKQNKISHNNKSYHHALQTKFKGSIRELRSKTLYAIAKRTMLPEDRRLQQVLESLKIEGFIEMQGDTFVIKYK